MNPIIYYQELAMRTKDKQSDNKLRSVAEYNRFIVNPKDGKMVSNSDLISAALGLSSKSSDIIKIIREFVYENQQIDYDSIIKELGDICWYIALFCDSLGISLEDVLSDNIDKLKEKYPYGYRDITSDTLKNINETHEEYEGRGFVDQIIDSII